MGLFGTIYNVANDYKHYKDQQANDEYLKALQDRIFEREDTAYQRTAADMYAAGLNPLSMQGTNGAGQAIQTSAPEAALQTESTATTLEKFINAGTNIQNTIQNIKSQEQSRFYEKLNYLKDYNKTLAEIDNLNIDTKQKQQMYDHLEREYKKMEEAGMYDFDQGFTQQIKAAVEYFTTELPERIKTLEKKYPFLKEINEFMRTGELTPEQAERLKKKSPFIYFMLSPFINNNEEKVDANPLNPFNENQTFETSDGKQVNVHVPYAH